LKHRCPWCGEFEKPPGERYFKTKKCPHCYNKYKKYNKSIINKAVDIPFLTLVCVISFLTLFEVLPIKSYFIIMIILLIIAIFLPSMPFEKDTDKFINELQNKTYITFYPVAENGLKFS